MGDQSQPVRHNSTARHAAGPSHRINVATPGKGPDDILQQSASHAGEIDVEPYHVRIDVLYGKRPTERSRLISSTLMRRACSVLVPLPSSGGFVHAAGGDGSGGGGEELAPSSE